MSFFFGVRACGRRRALPYGAAFGLFAWGSAPKVANADGVPVRARLSWVRAEGASGCPPVEAVRESVTKRLGRNPFDDNASRSFEIVATRSGNSWEANIHFHDAERATSGFRAIGADSSDCASLVNAVGLAVALAIDPDASLSAGPPPAPPVEKPSFAEPIVSHPPEPQRFWSTLSARGIVAPNVLPRWAAGVSLAAAVYGSSRMGISAGALFFPSVHTRSDPASFGFGLTAGWFDGCFLPLRRGTAMVRLCAGVRAGALHAVVYSPIPTDPGDRWWWSAGGGLAAQQQLVDRLFIEAGVEAMLPLIRYRFYAENSGETAFQQSVVMVSGFLGFGFRVD
jgi:hypothetical protein